MKFFQLLIFITNVKKPYVEISVGHTPDSDDAFMFYGMFTGKVSSPDFQINHVISSIDIFFLAVTIGPYPIPKLPPLLKIVYPGIYAQA